MTHEEYIKRILDIGYDVHLNDGVWWIKTEPFFYKPAIPMLLLEHGKAKPKMHKALLGYSYLVSNEKDANKHQVILLLKEYRLNNFGMKSLSSSKRAQVRKGLRLNEIRKLDAIENVIDDMKEIEMSKARRIGHEDPEYYTNNYDNWKASIIKQFNADKGKKDYWGAFHNGTMIAFMKILQINSTMIINYAASHTDHLDKCPNDALTFAILEYCRDLKDCTEVSYGAWDNERQSLNAFKQKYGFERVELPEYVKYNLYIIPVVRKLLESKHLKSLKVLIMSFLKQLKK